MPPKTLPSPKIVRKSHVAKSTAKSPSMYPKASASKYDTLSPNSQAGVVAEADGVSTYLKTRAKHHKGMAVARLFGQQPGSSEQHTGSPTKKKKKNNKGEVVSPDSPDCSPTAACRPPTQDGMACASQSASLRTRPRVAKGGEDSLLAPRPGH